MDLLQRLNIQAVNPGAYSGYQWHSTGGASPFVSVNPSDGEPIAAVVPCSLDDYAHIMTRSEQAFALWRQVPAPKRGDMIRQIGLALRLHQQDLGRLVSMEMGKSLPEGVGEVQEMIDMADFAVGQSRMLYGNSMHSERPQHRLYEQWHPLGVVGVISAFNFPVAVWAWNAFLAAICGNVTVWKPSAKTPLTAIATQHICNQVLQRNQCPEIFSLMVTQSHEVAEQLIMDKRVPLISFTGSTAVGKQVAVKVAHRLGRTLLELGGNNALIIDESANLDLAIPAIVFGAVGTSGQRCTSTRRLFVHQSQLQTVLTRLKKAYVQVTIGDPLVGHHLMGPLVDDQAVSAYRQAISDIRAAGGKIFYGGHVLPQKGYYVEPTIVTNIAHDAPLVQQETFAPILYVFPFETITEAVAMQNAVPQGLSSALFTQNLSASEYFLSALGSDCGIANINVGTSGAEIGGAFGGEKETGGGRESGSDAWKNYMRRQTNTINWGDTLPLAQNIDFKSDR